MKEKLVTDILMLMSGSFDKWWPNAPMAHALRLAESARRASTEIGTRLAESLAAHSGELTREAWRQMAVEATKEATMDVPDNSTPVRLSNYDSFADAVADCTANNVVPAGSKWFRDLEEEHVAAFRANMSKFKMSKHRLNCLVADFRAMFRQKCQAARG